MRSPSRWGRLSDTNSILSFVSRSVSDILLFATHVYNQTTYSALEAWSSINNPLKPENQDQISEQQVVVLALFTPWTHQPSAIIHYLNQLCIAMRFFMTAKYIVVSSQEWAVRTPLL